MVERARKFRAEEAEIFLAADEIGIEHGLTVDAYNFSLACMAKRLLLKTKPVADLRLKSLSLINAHSLIYEMPDIYSFG